MTGSKQYNVTINGVRKRVTGNSFEATLSTGLSIIRVDTDLECQGFVEKEVFISEDIHYYQTRLIAVSYTHLTLPTTPYV